MNQYISTKVINAKPMTRAAYNVLRGWTLPADEDGADAGYLVEYIDGGKPNHPDFPDHYISWSPADVFESAYHLVAQKDAAYSVTAQRMYEAFAAYHGPFFSGSPLVWDQLEPEAQAAWIAAAKAI